MLLPLSGRALVGGGGRAPDGAGFMAKAKARATHAKHPSRAGTLCGQRGASLIIAELNELAVVAADGGACRRCVATLESGRLYGRERRWSYLWNSAKANARRARRAAASAGDGGGWLDRQRRAGGRIISRK